MAVNVLTVPELAAELRISRTSAYQLVSLGLVRSVRVGRAIRVPIAAVAEFLEGSSEQDPAHGDAA